MRRTEDRPDRGLGAILHTLQALLEELPGLVSDRVRLLALELRLAGKSLGTMLVMALAALVFGGTAWVALWVGVVAALVAADLHWAWAVGLVLLVNLAAAAFAVIRALRLVGRLALPATVRHLTRSPLMTDDERVDDHAG
ncbi:MAG TPA: phage holin family protein [Burkholderiaceae bacterium]|nr:phage holin family protein [Burkholderiaceae bacterium]